MTLKSLLEFFDFAYKEYPDGYGLIDLQGSNLGSIQDERFENPTDLVTRLVDGIYGEDYLFSFDDDELKELGCADIKEYIAKYGNDKDYSEILYYSLHPDELDDLPPVLNWVNDRYDVARSAAENILRKKASEEGYSLYSLQNNTSPTPHTLTAVLFHNKKEQEEWENGTFEKGKCFPTISVDVNKCFDLDDMPEINDDYLL